MRRGLAAYSCGSSLGFNTSPYLTVFPFHPQPICTRRENRHALKAQHRAWIVNYKFSLRVPTAWVPM